MKAYVEWNAITRSYYVRLETRRAPAAKIFNLVGEPAKPRDHERGTVDIQTPRKSDAERAARAAGADEIIHCERDVVRALERNLGMKHESALECAREWFR